MIEVDTDGYDEQDQSEAFDETHLDDEGDGDIPFDLAPDVMDVTHADGDEDLEDVDEDDLTSARGVDEDADDDRLADAPDASAGLDDDDLDDPAAALEGDEVELAYTGAIDELRGAQSSAAHFEPRAELADDDVADLGYGPEDGLNEERT